MPTVNAFGLVAARIFTLLLAASLLPAADTPVTDTTPGEASLIQPLWMFTRDSDGNARSIFRVEGDLFASDKGRIGAAFGVTSVYNVLELGHFFSPETYGTAGVSGAWRFNKVFSLDGSAGVARLGPTLNEDGDRVAGRFSPVGRVLGHLVTPGEKLQIDVGFSRAFHDLSPQLIANRVARNEALVRSAVILPAGWRLRGRADLGVMTGSGERNGRYDSELTLARRAGGNSELYASYGNLHYTRASELGYYSPSQVHTYEGGWSTEIERRVVTLALDGGIGVGRARDHGEAYGPWGLSLRAQCDLKWRISSAAELWTSAEYDFNEFNSPLQFSPQPGWSMAALTVSLRWGYRGASIQARDPRPNDPGPRR